MESLDSKKIQQSDLILIIKDAGEQILTLFTLDKLKWVSYVLAFTLIGITGLHAIPKRLLTFIIRFFFPWLAAFFYFNFAVTGLLHIILVGFAFVLAGIWLLEWGAELFYICSGDLYYFWHGDTDEETSLNVNFNTMFALVSLILVFHQFVFTHYTEIPFLPEAINLVLQLYSYLPTF